MFKRTKMDVEGDGTAPKSLISLFLGTPIDDHLPRGTTGDVDVRKIGPVMVFNRDESLPRVMRALANEGFLSAPIVENKRFVGFVDMMDLVIKTRDLFWGDTVEAWVDFWDKEEKFLETTVEDVMKFPNQWDRDPCPPVPRDFTSFAALEMMVRQKLHRMAVVKPKTNRVVGIITQSMMISWLRQNRSLLDKLTTLKVSDICDDLQYPCTIVTESSKAINAFTEMANKGVSGMAVVDDQGALVDTISVRDLRAVGSGGEKFHRLFRSVKEFKNLARDDHPRLAPTTHYSRQRVPRQGLFVTKDQYLLTVLDKMADGNIHRVFVCESSNRPRPTHCISQVDLLRVVLDELIEQGNSL